jgi:hypothetical protein
MRSTLSRTNSAANLGKAFAAPLRPAPLDRDGAALDQAELAQPLHESGGPWGSGGRCGGAKKSDGRQRRVLRARRERPRRRAAQQRDELAAFHCPMPPVLQIERIANLTYGRRLLRCGILFQAMSLVGSQAAVSNRGKNHAYSITSSARASSEGGTVRPSALAVIRLMTRSNLVGCSIGRSAGFAPRRILST